GGSAAPRRAGARAARSEWQDDRSGGSPVSPREEVNERGERPRRGATLAGDARAGGAPILEDDGMCFCCGAKNPIGLKLQFEMLADRRMRTEWTPRKEHQGFK